MAPHAEAQAGLPDEQARQGTFGGADLAGPVAQAAGIGGAFLEGVADGHEAAVLGQGQARTSPAQHGQLVEQHAGGLWRNNGVGTLAGAAAGAGVLLLIMLPIMFHHQIQLFVCALLGNRYALRVTVSQPGEPAAHPKT